MNFLINSNEKTNNNLIWKKIFMSGMTFKENKNYSKAIECFEKVNKIKPNKINYYNWAETLIWIEEYKKASIKLKNGIELPSVDDYDKLISATMKTTLGIIFNILGFHKKAIEKFKESNSFKENYFNYYNWANTLNILGFHEEAIEKFQQADMIKHTVDNYYNWAKTLTIIGSYSEAIEKFNFAENLKEEQSILRSQRNKW